MKLLKAKKEDFGKIAEIYMEEFSKPPYNEPWTRKKVLDKVKMYSRYCDIWKVIVEKEIVGFIIVNPNFWYPGKFAFGEDIAIKKEYQGKSIGTKVMKNIFEIYKKRGFKFFSGLVNKEAKAFKIWSNLGMKENKYDQLIGRRLN